MKLFYKVTIISGVTICSIIILIVVSFMVYMTYRMPFNNYHLIIFQNDFRQRIKLFHPAQSSLITEVSEVGNWADGTYCEFVAGEFRSSPLPKEELEKTYPYDFFTAGVYFFDINYEENYGTLWRELKEKYLKSYKPKNGENVYLVWKSKIDYNTNGDFRCD